MYYSKKTVEPVVEETVIWKCSNESCVCWMRENFAFEQTPVCPICQSVMEKNNKMLPTIYNNNQKDVK
ncbi:cold-shock protein [Paenibacillus sp. N1-5-1-14]|uniref:cold-shock protein n=1 Tax=Paenibacillus radicibacter TaxID=2972488 RepID=UPI0021599EC7|nr:cold-shock protein [Paenibacillus radicibacter]MCR8643524.1 cold-shock protein [Paenibacillus radicibacter]